MEHQLFGSAQQNRSLTGLEKSALYGGVRSYDTSAISSLRENLSYPFRGDALQSGYPSGKFGGSALEMSGGYFSSELPKNDTAMLMSGQNLLSAAGIGSGAAALLASKQFATPVSASLQQLALPSPDLRSQTLPTVLGNKRPFEEVSQAVLGASILGQNALSSGNDLAKQPRLDSIANLPIYPQRPGEQDCTHYMRTRTCKFGATCKFDHPTWVPVGGIPDWRQVPNPDPPQRPGQPECSFYMKTGVCNYGSKCQFHHPKDRVGTKGDGSEEKPSEDIKEAQNMTSEKVNDDTTAVEKKEDQVASGSDNGKSQNDITSFKPATVFNSKGLPIRSDQQDCSFYLKTGSCKYGALCIYNHPDLKKNIPTTVVPFMNTSAVAPSLATPIQPLTSLPGFLTQHLPGATVFPQRPGQTECSYFLKTGKCKFGPLCKFHHPLDKLPRKEGAEVAPVKLTSAGFPRHEGQETCSYYIKTGTCKFGVNCKFDHPPPGELVAAAIAKANATKQDAEDNVVSTKA